MARMLEEVEKVVEKLSEEEVKELRHSLDHCVLMANKFYETGKPEYYARMQANCEKFSKLLRKFKEKAKK